MKNIDINKINELLKLGAQDNLKKAFDLFEKEKWTLKQIVVFIIENFKTETINTDLNGMVEGRIFYIGPLLFKFVVEEDWEPLDIDTYYKLVLYLSLRDFNGDKLVSCTISKIQSEQVNIVFTPSKEDTPSFIEKMDECTWKVFEDVDLQRTENLFDYLNLFYVDFIDKVDKKEIELYKWEWGE